MKAAEQRSFGGAGRSGPAAVAMAAALAFLVTFAFAAAARAADRPFEIEFDRSDVKVGMLGDLLGGAGLPLGEMASGASIKGTIAPDGTVTVPKGSFRMPELGIDDPVRLRAFMGIESPATGAFNPETGQLELDAQAGIWIRVDAAALLDLLGLDIGDLIGGSGGGAGGINIGGMIKPLLSNLTCGFAPMDVHFTTESNSLGSGKRFLNGPEGTGAITTEWSQLGPFKGQTKLLGLIDPCQMLLDFLPGLIEDGAGGALPGGVDLGGLDLAGLLANLNNLNLGPSSITLTRTVDESGPGKGPGNSGEEPRAGKPRLRIKAVARTRRVRSAKRARFRVTVRNTGRAPARKVRICMTGFAIRRQCVGLGKVKAGGSKRKVLKPRVNRKKLFRRSQRVLRPRFTVRAKNATRSRTRKARVRVMKPW